MKRTISRLLTYVLAVVSMTVILLTWGTCRGSLNVDLGEHFPAGCSNVYAAENVTDDQPQTQYSLSWEKKDKSTYTIILCVEGQLDGFDYGIAFSPKEVTVVEWGFFDVFTDHYGDQQGSVIDHYFSEGKRVSEDAQYIVYGGMATKQAFYNGKVCYVTVSLKSNQAAFYAVEKSAKYEHASELMASQVNCLVTEENDSGIPDENPKEDDTSNSQEAESGPDKPGGNASATNTPSENSYVTNKPNGNQTIIKENSSQTSSKINNSGTVVNEVKTGDDNPIIVYVVGVILAILAFVMAGGKYIQKNW